MSELLDWIPARDRVIAGVVPLAPVRVPLAEAHGLVLAEDVAAIEAMPPFDNSAMDGFAVREADLRGATPESPVRLRLRGSLPAGSEREFLLGPGETIQIMTGAPVPEGADAVVPVEHTDFWDAEAKQARDAGSEENSVNVHQHPKPSAHIRRTGESVSRGEPAALAGQRVQGAELGLLISVGISEVSVHPRPRVAVVATGNELVPPGQPLPRGGIRDSNRPALLASLKEHGFQPVDGGTAPDSPRPLETAFREAASRADFLITSGGVSVSTHDLTRRVLDRMGTVSSYRVAVKPGKPQLFGHLEGIPVFGLPGNPVSSLVVFDQFVLPALKKLAGLKSFLWNEFEAEFTRPFRRKAGRLEFVRVRLSTRDGRWHAEPTGPQGSGVLRSMTLANGYAILPPEKGSVEPGDRILCQSMETRP